MKTSQDKIVGLLEQAGKLPGEPEAEDIFSVFPFGRYTSLTPNGFKQGKHLLRFFSLFSSRRGVPVKGHQFFLHRP